VAGPEVEAAAEAEEVVAQSRPRCRPLGSSSLDRLGNRSVRPHRCRFHLRTERAEAEAEAALVEAEAASVVVPGRTPP
jgi:hypothetical protein